MAHTGERTKKRRARPTTTDNPPSTQVARVVVVAVVVKVVVVEVMVVVAMAVRATATRLGTIPLLRRITLDRLVLAVMTVTTVHPLAAPELAAISLRFQRTAPLDMVLGTALETVPPQARRPYRRLLLPPHLLSSRADGQAKARPT